LRVWLSESLPVWEGDGWELNGEIPKQPLRGPVLWERKRERESAGRGPKTMTSSLCAIMSGGQETHTHTHRERATQNCVYTHSRSRQGGQIPAKMVDTLCES